MADEKRRKSVETRVLYGKNIWTRSIQLNSDLPVDLPNTSVSNAVWVAFGRARVINKGFCNADLVIGPGVIISSTI